MEALNSAALSVMGSAYAAAAALIGPTEKDAGLERIDSLAKGIARRVVVAANEKGFLSLVENGNSLVSFPATIVRLDKEAKSNRAVITLKTGTTQARSEFYDKNVPLPEGYEQIRTERLDAGDEAKEIVIAARDHIGWKVRVTREMQAIENPKPGQKGYEVRICRAIEILEPDPEFVVEG